MQIHTDKLPTLIEFAHRGLLRRNKREHPEHARSGRTRGAEAPLLHDIKEENARQLVSRARKHIATGRREPTSSAEQKRLLEALVAAAQEGDVEALEKLLADDVVSYTDGNGMRGASRIPVVGRSVVDNFLKAFAPRLWRDTEVTWIEANGQASVLISRDADLVTFLAISASRQGIDRLLWVMSPEKLRAISKLLPSSGDVS